MKIVERAEVPDMEEESWNGTAEVFPPYKPKSLKRRMGSSPFSK